MYKIFKFIIFLFFSFNFLDSTTEKKLFNSIPVTEFKLENGLSIVILKKDSPVTAIATIIGAGSLNDPYKKSGLAHFVEHSMFEGLNKGNGFINFTKTTGATFNAYTGFRETVFFTIVPNDYIDELFYFESLRLKKFFIPPKVAYNERNVVLQEALMYESNNTLQLLLETIATIIKNNHYNIPIPGYTDEIKKLTINDVVTFIKKYYVPSNIKLTIVSGLPIEEIIAKIKKYFAPIKAINSSFAPKEINFVKNDFKYHIVKKSSQVGMPAVYFVYHIAEKLSHKEKVAIELICNIFNSGYEYLYTQIIKKDKIASFIETIFNSDISGANMLPPNIVIISMTPISKDYKKSEEILQKRIFEIVSQKISKESLQNAKNTIKNSIIRSEDSFMVLFNLLQKLGTKYSYEYCNEEIQLLDEIDEYYINTILQKYFSKTPNAVSVITNNIFQDKGGNND